MKMRVLKKLEFKDWLQKMFTNLPIPYMMGTMTIMTVKKIQSKWMRDAYFIWVCHIHIFHNFRKFIWFFRKFNLVSVSNNFTTRWHTLILALFSICIQPNHFLSRSFHFLFGGFHILRRQFLGKFWPLPPSLPVDSLFMIYLS